MKRKGLSHSVDTVFVLSLFCVFAASVLITLILGTKIQGAMEKTSDEAYYSRTALSYITEKLRHCDQAGCVEISNFKGLPALVVTEFYDDVEYETIIYAYKGAVRELFHEKGVELKPSAGTEIIEGRALSFDLITDRLVRIEYSDMQGKSSYSLAYIRSGGAA